jgi:two-component system sensor histidine kinase HydH
MRKRLDKSRFVLGATALALVSMVVTLAWCLGQLGQRSADTQLLNAKSQSAFACSTLTAGLKRFEQLQGVPNHTATQAVIDMALRDLSGLEGGFWQADRGVIAYAFPTYDGTGIKLDPPTAELARIVATAQRALDSKSLLLDVRPGQREAVVFSACVVEGDAEGRVAWTLMRVPTASAQGSTALDVALSLLLGFVVAGGAVLLWVLRQGAQERTRALEQVAVSERLAMIGEMSAGLAHEIRNPLGTIRIKVENALAAPPSLREQRTDSALKVVLEQIQRLETLASSLLALTQLTSLQPQPIDVSTWLREVCRFYRERAQQQGVDLRLELPPGTELDRPVIFDPQWVRRALDNLLLNAFAHVPAGGTIRVGASRPTARSLILWVEDDGEGVAPALRDSLFAPFVSHRSGGSGLGLALVQEVARTHKGRARLVPSEAGARFEMELGQ